MVGGREIFLLVVVVIWKTVDCGARGHAAAAAETHGDGGCNQVAVVVGADFDKWALGGGGLVVVCMALLNARNSIARLMAAGEE